MKRTDLAPDEIQRIVNSCQNVAETFRYLEDQFAKVGDVVCEIHMDGLRLDEYEQARLATVPLGQVRAIEVYSSSPYLLVEEAAESTRDLCLSIAKRAITCADSFRAGEINKACETFFPITTQIEQVVESILNIRRILPLSLELTASPFKEIPTDTWDQAEAVFLDTSRELFSAFQKRDFISVADVMEYDLGNVLQEWARLLAPFAIRKQTVEQPEPNRENTLG